MDNKNAECTYVQGFIQDFPLRGGRQGAERGGQQL